MGQHSARPTAERRPWLRLRALLAGGLVLGVGATATLAAWTDTEHARTTIGASTFATQVSLDGLTYTPTGPATPLVLALDAGGLSPSSKRYASLFIGTTAASTVGGTASLGAAVVTGDGAGTEPTALAAHVYFRVVRLPGGQTCNQNQFTGSPEYVAGGTRQPLNGGTGTSSVNLAAGAGSPVHLCFEVELDSAAPSSLQGQTLTAVWPLTAISTS